jgi:integrase
MSLTTTELEELIRLALSALRGQAVAPAGAVAALAAAQPEPVQAGQTLGEWLVTYRAIISERGYKVSTIKNREASLKHIEAILGGRPLKLIKPHEIASQLKQFSPHTAGRLLGELRDVYVEAIANGSSESSPAAHVKAPQVHGLRKRLTLETWRSMLTLSKAGPQKWVPAMLLLALATGQRRGDLAKMRFDDVVGGCLRVEQQKKARKPIGARVAIPLTLKLNASGMTLGDVVEYCRGIGEPGPTLLRKSGGGPIEMSSLSARFHEHILSVAGPDAYKQYEWPSLHEIRSLSARTYIAEGMTPVQVQTLLGHKHFEMTDLYLDDRGLTDGVWKTVDSNVTAQPS